VREIEGNDWKESRKKKLPNEMIWMWGAPGRKGAIRDKTPAWETKCDVTVSKW